MTYMNTDKFTIASGHLDVGDGHKIWWHQWGNPKSSPIFVLHGGPGGGSKDKYKLNFDPTTQQVVFHDQRGSGQSTPFGSIEHNTTQYLIADIEKLRVMLGYKKIMLAGGSWGSFLGFAYTIMHPDSVTKMLLGGIYLGTKAETDYIQQGGSKTHYPEAWEQYIQVVPQDQRHNSVAFYLDKFRQNTPETQDYVRRWCLNEGTLMSIDSDYKRDEQQSYEYDESDRTPAMLEAHYFINNCFVEDNYIFNNAFVLKDIPIVLMQGRHDHVCPPQTAYKITAAIGPNCHLHIMPGGHANEFVTREVLRAYSFAFLGN
jgi:proline iminopeptidase